MTLHTSSHSTPLVALFIDFENLYISAMEHLGAPPDWQQVLQYARSFGRLVLARAYGDWSNHQNAQPHLQNLGIELIHIPRASGKNASDIQLIIDAIDLTILSNPTVEYVVLATGDGDFRILARYLKRHGKVVVGIGLQPTTSSALIQACDQFVFYSTLTRKPSSPTPSRQPTAASPTANAALVEEYLQAIGTKVRMTPSVHRPKAILDFYRFFQQHSGKSLSTLYNLFTEQYKAEHPEIPPAVITGVVHQLFHTYCFHFLPPEKEQLWDREVVLDASIRSGTDLLRKCDQGLLQILKRNLPGQDIDVIAATYILYGRTDNPRTQEYVSHLLRTVQT